MKYRDAIRSAIAAWNRSEWFRSRSAESQAAVSAMELTMREPTDESLSDLVNWLVGVTVLPPAAFSHLTPIKAQSRLRTELNAALLVADRPVHRVQQASVRPAVERRRAQVAPPRASAVAPSSAVVSSASSARPASVAPRVTPSAASQPAVTPRPAAPRPAPTPTPTPAPAPPPSAAAAPSAASAPASGAVRRATRYLMNDCVHASGGTMLDMWTQTSICQMLAIPSGKFEGFCAAATARWLLSGDLRSFKSQRGSIDTLRLQAIYDHGTKSVEDFYNGECHLTGFVASSEADILTAEKVLTKLEGNGKATKHLLAIVPLGGGDGHAIGITVVEGVYHFLDVNEGLARLPSRSAFWSFLYKYVHDDNLGLLRQGYVGFWVASWR